MSTVQCSVTLRKSRQCRRKIKKEKAGKPPDCGMHTWINEANEKLSEQQSLFDKKKHTDDNLTRIARNEKRSIEDDKRRAEDEKRSIENEKRRAESADAELSSLEENRVERSQEAHQGAQQKKADIEENKSGTANREAHPEECTRLIQSYRLVRQSVRRAGKIVLWPGKQAGKLVLNVATNENAKRATKFVADNAMKAFIKGAAFTAGGVAAGHALGIM